MTTDLGESEVGLTSSSMYIDDGYYHETWDHSGTHQVSMNKDETMDTMDASSPSYVYLVYASDIIRQHRKSNGCRASSSYQEQPTVTSVDIGPDGYI